MREDAVEGWCTDPYEVHEARWMSAGAPTNLVRDGGTESTDEPPQGPPTAVARRIEVDSPPRSGLRRADDAERGPDDPRTPARAAWDAFDEGPGPG